MQVFLYLVTNTHLASKSNSLNLLETELPLDKYKVVAFSLRGAKPMESGDQGLFAQDFSGHSFDLLAVGSWGLLSELMVEPGLALSGS